MIGSSPSSKSVMPVMPGDDNITQFPAATRPIPPTMDRILAAIRDAPQDQVYRLQTQAIEHLAKLNGWTFGTKKRFVPFNDATLQDHHFFDHQIIFSDAFVIQPYSFRFWREKVDTIVATQRRPLAVFISPILI